MEQARRIGLERLEIRGRGLAPGRHEKVRARRSRSLAHRAPECLTYATADTIARDRAAHRARGDDREPELEAVTATDACDESRSPHGTTFRSHQGDIAGTPQSRGAIHSTVIRRR